MTLENADNLVQSPLQAKPRDGGAVRLRVRCVDVSPFLVIGDVDATGAYTMNGRESVPNGIVRAGGLTSGADVSKILDSRPTKPGECRKVMPVCYRNIVHFFFQAADGIRDGTVTGVQTCALPICSSSSAYWSSLYSRVANFFRSA